MFGLALLLLHNEEESRDAVSEVFATLMEGGKMPDAQHVYATAASKSSATDTSKNG